VDATHNKVTYGLRDGPDARLTIRHAGTEIELSTQQPTTVDVRPRKPLLPAPPQPVGREPMRRHIVAE
jgi:hypothetical protein